MRKKIIHTVVIIGALSNAIILAIDGNASMVNYFNVGLFTL